MVPAPGLLSTLFRPLFLMQCRAHVICSQLYYRNHKKPRARSEQQRPKLGFKHGLLHDARVERKTWRCGRMKRARSHWRPFSQFPSPNSSIRHANVRFHVHARIKREKKCRETYLEAGSSKERGSREREREERAVCERDSSFSRRFFFFPFSSSFALLLNLSPPPLLSQLVPRALVKVVIKLAPLLLLSSFSISHSSLLLQPLPPLLLGDQSHAALLQHRLDLRGVGGSGPEVERGVEVVAGLAQPAEAAQEARALVPDRGLAGRGGGGGGGSGRSGGGEGGDGSEEERRGADAADAASARSFSSAAAPAPTAPPRPPRGSTEPLKARTSPRGCARRAPRRAKALAPPPSSWPQTPPRRPEEARRGRCGPLLRKRPRRPRPRRRGRPPSRDNIAARSSEGGCRRRGGSGTRPCPTSRPGGGRSRCRTCFCFVFFFSEVFFC